MIRLLISLLLSLGVTLISSAESWPTRFEPSASSTSIKQLSNENGVFLYESNSFRIRSSVKLEAALLANFAASAEAVAQVMQKIPLPLFAPPKNSRGLIEITSDVEAYRKAGGAPGTAGYYDGRNGRIIVQWDQLNRKSSGSKLIHRPAFDLLVHELTHLCMGKWLWKMEPWLVEGTAEYFAAAHLTNGQFDFIRIDSQIRNHIQKLTPVKEGKETVTMKMESLLKLSSKDWLHRTAGLSPEEALKSYTAALVLTHYAFHGGSERRKEVRTYLEALEEVTFIREKKPVLFPLAEAAKIETRIQSYWRNKGLKLGFE